MLFDLKNDPAEKTPLDDPALASELRAKILAWRTRSKEQGGEVSLDEQRALLIQMGYVGLANELDEDTTDERKQEIEIAESLDTRTNTYIRTHTLTSVA